MIPCSWKEAFGIDCPACGTQRSFAALLHGHLWESILLFPALLPLIAVFMLTVVHLFRPLPNGARWIVRLFILSAVLMFGNWLVKVIVFWS